MCLCQCFTKVGGGGVCVFPFASLGKKTLIMASYFEATTCFKKRHVKKSEELSSTEKESKNKNFSQFIHHILDKKRLICRPQKCVHSLSLPSQSYIHVDLTERISIAVKSYLYKLLKQCF